MIQRQNFNKESDSDFCRHRQLLHYLFLLLLKYKSPEKFKSKEKNSLRSKIALCTKYKWRLEYSYLWLFFNKRCIFKKVLFYPNSSSMDLSQWQRSAANNLLARYKWKSKWKIFLHEIQNLKRQNFNTQCGSFFNIWSSSFVSVFIASEMFKKISKTMKMLKFCENNKFISNVL